jgi:hypothetical protein
MEKPKWQAFAALLGVLAAPRPVPITLSAGVAKYHHTMIARERRGFRVNGRRTVRPGGSTRQATRHLGIELKRQRIADKERAAATLRPKPY